MRLRSRQGFVPAAEIVDPRRALHEMRLRKEPAELEIMRRAAAISAEAHREAARLAEEGRFEYELEAALLHQFRRHGAAGPAYSSIVGGGRNATVLHYIRNDQKLTDGELVLIDAGCELDGYASDVTRTYPVGGSYRGAQRAVYEAVLEANLAGMALAKPGATLPQIHQATTRKLVEGMVELGLLSGPRGRPDPERDTPTLLHAQHQPLARPRRARRGRLRGGRRAARARAGHGVHDRARPLHRGRRPRRLPRSCAASGCASKTTWRSPPPGART